MNLASQPFWFVILSLGITGSIVGAIVAAVASAINERSRRRFESRKWRAEFYLRPKLEALRNLHSAMVRSHYEIIRADTLIPQNHQEYQQQVERPEMEFLGAFTLAGIYLDEETRKMMRHVLGSVRQMSTSIWVRLPENSAGTLNHPDRVPDFRAYTDAFDAAQERLRELLNPDEVIKWVET